MRKLNLEETNLVAGASISGAAFEGGIEGAANGVGVGAGVGFALGGPAGALVGGMIGGFAGTIIGAGAAVNDYINGGGRSGSGGGFFAS